MNMELDDFKGAWNAAIIKDKTKTDFHYLIFNKKHNTMYRSLIKKITLPEITGSIVCIAGAMYVAVNFSKLDTLLLQSVGIVSILTLLILPGLSLLSIYKLNSIGDVSKSHAAVLKEFAVKKLQFLKLQKLNVTLSYLLMVTMIILFSKFFDGKDLSVNKNFWLISLPVGYIFLLFYSKWIMKYYRNTLKQAQELLNELSAER